MIVNLTPHELNLYREDGTVLTVPASGTVARVSVKSAVIGHEDGIPILRSEYGEVTDLPDMEDGVLYVVSMLVKSALPERSDLVAPADLVRDDEGRIIGAKGLTL